MNLQRFVHAVLVALCAGLCGCAQLPTLDSSRLSALEVRAVQTRVYEGNDSKATLKALMNVLQDDGFLVDYGNADLGLLHATKTLSATRDQTFTPAITFFSAVDVPAIPGSMVTIDATANVSDFGPHTKVRINFQRTVITRTFFGAVRTTAAPVSDPKSYQDFFIKLERGLFIQKQGL